MLTFFLLTLSVPLVIAAGCFVFMESISLKELACVVGGQLMIVIIATCIASYVGTHDVETWNGCVVSKQQVQVSCSHSYSCNCHEVCSGSGKDRSCNEHCDTCYEHSHDYDWEVYTSNDETINIDRIDRQGATEPARFTKVRLGEPTAVEHSYKNYVKAAPGTLFRHQGLVEKYTGKLPKYPDEVYDYFHLDRLVTMGFMPNDSSTWNVGLEKLNAGVGRAKQVNVIVVLVKDQPQDWYYALEEFWIGGKKNDAVLVVDVDENMKPQWSAVMAWTTNELFKVKLRDDVMKLAAVTPNATLAILDEDVRDDYVRKPMKDFEYLKSQVTPTLLEWVLTNVLSVLVTIGLIVFFHINRPFRDQGMNFRTYHYPR